MDEKRNFTLLTDFYELTMMQNISVIWDIL